MARKVVLLSVSLVMVVALLLVSCGPSASEPTPVTPTPGTPTPAIPALAPTLTPAASAEEPKYGGALSVIVPTHTEVFVPLVPRLSTWGEGYILEQILTMDYTRGKAGTGEADYGAGGWNPNIPSWEFVVGWLAESFEIPGNGVWVVNVRQGVHFALDPSSEASRLVGGREMTADDVKYSWEILRDTPETSHNNIVPGLMKNLTVEKTGPWQVTLRTPVDAAVGYAWEMGGGGVQYVWAREWLDKYAKTNRWQDMVGTGPYMLTDFISGSVATLKRNPNYWRKDPLAPGKGNQLPYPDGVKIFIIPDLSTRLAVMRTAKGDMVEEIESEDAKGLLMTNPSLQSYGYVSTITAVAMRTNKEDLPYKDVRVRQALMMATDFESIKNDFYGGQADIYNYPIGRTVKHIFIPIEEQPKAVQELYKYNPTRAKQLLAEAGYPAGFKAKMIVKSVTAELDLAAVVKAMWAKVGVDVQIQPKEQAAYTSITNVASHEELILASSGAVQLLTGLSPRYQFRSYQAPAAGNLSFINNPRGSDPLIEETFQFMSANFMVNPLETDRKIREFIPHVLEQAYYIAMPSPYLYRIWQPWVKGYYGEGGLPVTEAWAPYPWVDQDLKEKMTGRR